MEPYVRATGSPETLRVWRYLQISDHLYYMYTAPGASGLVHGYFSSQPPVKAFWTYNRVLSSFQGKIASILEEPLRTSALLLRIVPPDRAFHFHEDGRYTDLSAHSLEELLDAMSLATERSLAGHLQRGDIRRWLRDSVGDQLLAQRIDGLDPEERTRPLIREMIEERVNNLKAAARSPSSPSP
jgi:hypothetical protein